MQMHKMHKNAQKRTKMHDVKYYTLKLQATK